MRVKAEPNNLSLKIRKEMGFTYHVSMHLSVPSLTPKSRKKGKKRTALTDEQRELTIHYPHSLILLVTPAPRDFLLQTLSFPIGASLPIVIDSGGKIHLFFDRSSLLLLHESGGIVHEFVITDADRLTPLLFAASCTQFDVHYRLSDQIMDLDICLKPRCLTTISEVPTRTVTLQQYEKVLDFLTLQLIDGDAFPLQLKQFVYGSHSETQQEFITLIKLLYDCAQSFHESTRSSWDRLDLGVQNKNITTILRPYQIDAVKWMVHREENLLTVNKNELYRSLFRPIKLGLNKKTIYFSLMTGTFVEELPILQDPCLGGILADEMGLGKTLEVIALILLRPWSDWAHSGGQIRDLERGEVLNPAQYTNQMRTTDPRQSCNVLCSCGNVEETVDFELIQCVLCLGPCQHTACVQYDPSKFYDELPVKYGYICPNCWGQLRIDSKATLIVAPDHIWQQWKEELQTHIVQDSVNILLYAGMEAPVTTVVTGVRVAPPCSLSKTANPFAPRTRVSARVSDGPRKGDNGEPEEELLPGFVQPCQLACADIVLTSYSVVQRELDWAEVIAERRAGVSDRPQLRLAQRYLCRPSPLTCVRWWRVCLDEAQMVERVTSKTARMLFQIDAVHRWCVTGTPAEKSIDDLYGLFAYLRFEPFCFAHYWKSLLYQPFLAATAPSWLDQVAGRSSDEPVQQSISVPQATKAMVQSTRLATVLGSMLWRNTKHLVGNQLILPPITEQIHWVSFTPVERYIHDRVLAQSIGALQRLLQSMSISPDQPLASLPGAVHWRLVYLITRLRQACTHASLVVAAGSQPSRPGRSDRSRRGHRRSGQRALPFDGLGDVDSDDVDSGFSTALSGAAAAAGDQPSAARAQRHIGTGCFTMTEVIRRVVDETRRECEGLLRTWAFNKNGAAGCFIIKEQFVQAADCYRDVLRTANSLERRHGVLADWSQRLHAITNLHWLIQSRDVPLSQEPVPPVLPIELTNTTVSSGSVISVQTGQPGHGSRVDTEDLDPRVDRDLIAKAERLRTAYILSHSHLLAKVHESLSPVTAKIDRELEEVPEKLDDQNTSTSETDHNPSPCNYPMGSSWLNWLSDALDLLASSGLGTGLIDMLVSSFQGLPGGARQNYRTSLLYAGSIENFKSMLLAEINNVFIARQQLCKAMEPLISTWKSFQAGEPVDPSILRPFYACCARAADAADNEATKTTGDDQLGSPESSDHSGGARKRKREDAKARELKQLASSLPRRPRKQTKCAYCTAVRALRRYQTAVNCERPGSTVKRHVSIDTDTSMEALDDEDETGTGLVRNNPLTVAISIVCHQLIRLLSADQVPNAATILPVSEWRHRARRLEQLFRQMGTEIMLTSRTQSLTKEWWNIHDDTEQFVVRLQATCPTDLAFIHSYEVDAQLQSYIVEATLVWPRLQSRLGHFSFLRNAHLAAVTGANSKDARPEDNPDAVGFRLECPTCLQAHSPTNPTFVLLPGCWHALCLQCHNRIASLGLVAQRRCPICRTPFTSNENARRRRPLTLIHYTDNKQAPEQLKDESIQNSARPDSDAIKIVGDHSSKVQAVIRCLKQIKQHDPDAKAIVFSSWLSVLITIAGAMEQNGLSYTTLFQARDACCPGRLTGFQCMGSATWVLLMPIQLGANGLNLTSANHILLVDPVLSHGREAQAVARIHRIGQTRPGTVHRFLVQDSIEAALHTAHARSQPDTAANGDYLSSVECMVGAGVRRTSSSSCGVAGPSEDKAQLMSMTIGQLAELLRFESNNLTVLDDGGDGSNHDM